MRKILLVDDDADDQLLFQDALQEINSKVNCEIANNGQEALNNLEVPPPPDLIFLDLNMPVMNGFICLSELRKKESLKNVPVIIFTTTSEHEAIKKTHSLGANAFLKKPNDFSTLLSKLEELLTTDFSNKKVKHPFSVSEFSI